MTIHSLNRREIWLPTVFGLLMLAAWEAIVRAGLVSRIVLASPVDVVVRLFSSAPELAYHAGVTLAEALIGFALGNLAGLLMAMLFVQFARLRQAAFPLAVLCEAIPVVAVLPVLNLWLGNGMAPKIFIAGFLSFFPMLVNAYRGLSNVDADIAELLLTYSARPAQVFRTIRLPSAVPYMFTALKLSACGAMVAALVAEWLASEEGLGYLIIFYGQSYRIADVWAAAVLACLLSLSLYALVAACEKLVLRRMHRLA